MSAARWKTDLETAAPGADTVMHRGPTPPLKSADESKAPGTAGRKSPRRLDRYLLMKEPTYGEGAQSAVHRAQQEQLKMRASEQMQTSQTVAILGETFGVTTFPRGVRKLPDSTRDFAARTLAGEFGRPMTPADSVTIGNDCPHARWRHTAVCVRCGFTGTVCSTQFPSLHARLCRHAPARQ